MTCNNFLSSSHHSCSMANFPRFLIIGLLVGLSVVTGCKSDNTPQPTATTTSNTVTVSVSEAGAPSYNLTEAHIINANYQTGAAGLTISGKLNNGKVLVLDFVRNGSTTANTTNILESSLNGNTGTNSVGTTTYNPQTRTVSGTFRSTFPTVGEISGSFSGLPVQ